MQMALICFLFLFFYDIPPQEPPLQARVPG